MSNLGRTQADWRKIFRELGLFLAPVRELRELTKRFDISKTRTRVLEEGDQNATTWAWRLHGAEIGANTDEAGTIFVRIALGTPAAGSAQVSLFRATGGNAQDLVAQGVGALGTVVTLAAQNGSGLSGSVQLGQLQASEQDDSHRLPVFPDWAARMHSVLDGSEPEHGELLEAYMEALDEAKSALDQALQAFSQATSTFLESRWKNFQRSSQGAAIQLSSQNDQGAVSFSASGLLEDGRDNMQDELTAGPQSVPKNVLVAAPAVFDQTNKGKGVLVAPVLSEWARPGRITAVCTDATLGEEQFTLSEHLSSDEDRSAQNPLTIRRNYADSELGIQSTFLGRLLTLDQGSTDNFGAPAGSAGAGWEVQGESAQNTEQGKIALKVVAQGAVFLVEGYSSSSFAPETKVFQTAPGAAGATVAITEANSSGLTGTALLGAKPTANDTGTLNLNPFAMGDKFVVDVTESSRGAFQEELSLLYGYALASADPQKATIDDRYVTAGTLPPFEDVS